MKIENFYTWKNIDGKIWEGKLIEKRENWLQFAIWDEEMNNFDGFMVINFDILKNFSEMNFDKNIKNTSPGKKLENKSFQGIMEDGLLVEIVAQKSQLVEDEGDLFFEEGEYRFYPVEQDGTYLNDGYLPMQENNIASIYYDNEYLKNIEKLSKEKGYL